MYDIKTDCINRVRVPYYTNWIFSIGPELCHKTQKYADLTDGYDFRSFTIEIIGAFGPSALELINSLVGRIHAQTSESWHSVTDLPADRISSAVHAILLKQIRARLPGGFYPRYVILLVIFCFILTVIYFIIAVVLLFLPWHNVVDLIFLV